jgi:hypothetical protein
MIIHVIGTNGHLANDYGSNSPLEEGWVKFLFNISKENLFYIGLVFLANEDSMSDYQLVDLDE